MQEADLSEVCSYELPRAFWAALLEVRNYWILEGKFGDHIYHTDNLDSSLRRAFDLMDNYLERVLLDWEDELR
jgi:hypothetical protein